MQLLKVNSEPQWKGGGLRREYGEWEREAVEKRKTFEKWPLMMNFLLAAIYDNGDASADSSSRESWMQQGSAVECAPGGHAYMTSTLGDDGEGITQESA